MADKDDGSESKDNDEIQVADSESGYHSAVCFALICICKLLFGEQSCSRG